MQGSLFPDPVDVDHQVRRGNLLDVDDLVALEDRQVHRLAGSAREFLEHRSRRPRKVEFGDDRAGQANQAIAEAIAFGRRILLHQPMLLEGRQQPEGRGLVNFQPASQVRNPHLRLAAEQLEDLKRSI